MLESWLSPVLTWLGIGLVPFLIIIFIIVYIIKS
jgi:hypothetical protein